MRNNGLKEEILFTLELIFQFFFIVSLGIKEIFKGFLVLDTLSNALTVVEWLIRKKGAGVEILKQGHQMSPNGTMLKRMVKFSIKL